MIASYLATYNSYKSIFFFSSSSKGSGKHWFVLFLESTDTLQVFDSLGVKKDLILKHIPKYAKKVIANTSAVQAASSSTCGQFCCYFIMHRYLSLDLAFDDLLNAIFTSDTSVNEREVQDFLS